jgi:spore germination protein YaaH
MIRPASAVAALLVIALSVGVSSATPGPAGVSGLSPGEDGSAGASSSPAPPYPLGSGAAVHRPHEVFGFLPYWSVADWTDAYLRYDLLTTIAFFGVGERDDGSLLRSGPGYTAYMSDLATTIIDHAHAAGVRTVITFESFGTSHNHKFLSNPAARTRFVNDAIALMTERGADGANLDTESLAGTDRPNWGLLVAEFASAAHRADPGAEVSVAVNGNVSGARMAAIALNAGADRAFLMGYSYRVGSSPTSGSISPMSGTGTSLDLGLSLDLYEANGVAPEKIILGLPYYGLTWATLSGDLDAPRQPDSAGFGRGVAFRPRVLATTGGPQLNATLDHDMLEVTARYTWYDSVKGTWLQTYFDDPTTLALKEHLAVDRGLAGVGIWALGDDAGVPGYWETIAATIFGGPPYVPPSPQLSPSPPTGSFVVPTASASPSPARASSSP